MNLIQGTLQTRQLGREITYYPFTDSTNEDLWQLLDKGAAVTGQVVVTDNQRSGRGRKGRRWFCAPNLGLPFSVLLCPDLSIDRLGLLSLAMGVAVIDALAADGIESRLKWPNDILVDRRKLGGILAESRPSDEGLVVVMGVGLNVNEQLEDFPDQLRPTAVSVHMVLGKPLPRELLLTRILNRFEQLLESNLAGVIALWHARCAHLGQLVRWHSPEGLVEGRFLGVNEAGEGEIDSGDQIRVVTAGDLDWKPERFIIA
ncbi:MAG: biotin--[acetyl-CoA-carboxylase] ligase [Candidatus Neomarinimicrobiota bacterium]